LAEECDEKTNHMAENGNKEKEVAKNLNIHGLPLRNTR
jgi:hypothetical protein